MKLFEIEELKRVSLNQLRKEVNKMPVFNMANPPELEKEQPDSIDIDIEASDIVAGVSPFAS